MAKAKQNVIQMTAASGAVINVREINLKPLIGFDFMVQIPADDNERVPPVNEQYIIPKNKLTRDTLLWWFAKKQHKGLAYVGPTGCGKTSLITQFCAMFNWPLRVGSIHGETRPEELESATSLVEGKNGSVSNTMLGDLPACYKNGWAYLLDEGNRSSDAMRSYLNPYLERRPVSLLCNGELITPHPLFRFFMSGNAGSGGDATGLYTDSNPYCISFADRFRYLLFAYPERAEEKRIIQQYAPSLPDELIDKVLDLTVNLRELNNKGDANGFIVTKPFSTRTIVDWASAMEDEYREIPVADSLAVTYMNSLVNDVEKEAVLAAYKLRFGKQTDWSATQFIDKHAAVEAKATG